MATDFNAYPQWEKVVAPNGAVYYVVPETGLLYSPSISALKGKPVVFTDPRQAVKEQQDQKDAIKDAQKPSAQIMPVAAGTVGTIGGALAIDYLRNKAPSALETAQIDALKQQQALIDSRLGGIKPTNTQENSTIQQPASVQTAPQVVPTTTSSAFVNTAVPSNSFSGMTVDASLPVPQLISANRVALPPTPELVRMNRVQLNPDGSVITPPATSTAAGFLQGASGLYGVYQGAQDYKEGNMLGAGINTIGGGTMALQGANLLGASIAPQTVGQLASVTNPILGAYGAYQTIKGWKAPAGGQRNTSSTLSGAAAGLALGGPIGAGIGATIGLIGSLTGSSKDKYQMMRDGVRKELDKGGFFEQKNEKGSELGSLADGTMYDFGKDGQKHGKLNTTNPMWGEGAALANVLVGGMGISDGKARTATATMFSNAAVSNAKDEATVRANYKHFADKLGFTPESIKAGLDKLYADNGITEDEYKVGIADINKIYGDSPTPTKGAPISGANNVNVTPAPGFIPKRSKTSSPGVGLPGVTLTPQQMGQNLAARIDRR